MPRPPTRKMLGEQAECVFLAQAVGRGFIVSKPYGDSAPYDFILSRIAGVSAAGARRRNPERSEGAHWPRLHLIQVKSVGCKDPMGRYTVNTRRSFSRAYLPGELDFFACWIVPLDLWYIIPASSVVPRKCVHLYPDVPDSRGKYEKYRDAWDLLR